MPLLTFFFRNYSKFSLGIEQAFLAEGVQTTFEKKGYITTFRIADNVIAKVEYNPRNFMYMLKYSLSDETPNLNNVMIRYAFERDILSAERRALEFSKQC